MNCILCVFPLFGNFLDTRGERRAPIFGLMEVKRGRSGSVVDGGFKTPTKVKMNLRPLAPILTVISGKRGRKKQTSVR